MNDDRESFNKVIINLIFIRSRSIIIKTYFVRTKTDSTNK